MASCSPRFLFLFMLFCCVSRAFSDVKSRGDITKTVGENATFEWNATSSIDEAKWGLFDGTDVFPFFIKVNTFKPGVVQYSSDLDTDKASQYKNRVHFTGNITTGRAWFVLKNLSLADTKMYAARIILSGVPKVYQMKLTVLPPPTTSPPITITTSGLNSSTTTTSSTTIGSTTKSEEPTTETKGLSGGAIAGISVAVIVVVVGGVALVIYIVKKSKNNGSNGSNNKSGPLELDKPTGDGNPTSPEA